MQNGLQLENPLSANNINRWNAMATPKDLYKQQLGIKGMHEFLYK